MCNRNRNREKKLISVVQSVWDGNLWKNKWADCGPEVNIKNQSKAETDLFLYHGLLYSKRNRLVNFK